MEQTSLIKYNPETTSVSVMLKIPIASGYNVAPLYRVTNLGHLVNNLRIRYGVPNLVYMTGQTFLNSTKVIANGMFFCMCVVTFTPFKQQELNA